jgi:hypothetical protein
MTSKQAGHSISTTRNKLKNMTQQTTSYSFDDSRSLRDIVQNINNVNDLNQFLIDLKEFIDERGCDFKNKQENSALIELLVYLKDDIRQQIKTVSFLKQFPPQFSQD